MKYFLLLGFLLSATVQAIHDPPCWNFISDNVHGKTSLEPPIILEDLKIEGFKNLRVEQFLATGTITAFSKIARWYKRDNIYSAFIVGENNLNQKEFLAELSFSFLQRKDFEGEMDTPAILNFF